MNRKKEVLADLREITLWHQLNRLFVESGELGDAISPEHHHFLRSFCFDNRLFKSIAEAHNLFEVPLILITDFEDIAFVTLKMDEWTQCLLEFLRIFKPGTHYFVLDLDEALAGAYDVLNNVDRRYNLTETTTADIAEDGDELLFDFINQYLERKANVGYDFESLVLLFHEIKAQFLRRIISQTPGVIPLERINDRLLIVTRDRRQKSVFHQIYRENFLPKLSEASSLPIDTLIYNEDLVGYLKEQSEERRHVPIKDFADAEVKQLQEQNQILSILNNDVTRLVGAHRIYLPNIPIVDLPSLIFLRSPFPAIMPSR